MANLPASGYLVADKIVKRDVGAKLPYSIEREFDLATLLAAVIADADVVNLFQLPAEHVIVATALETLTAGTKDATTFTLQLRVGTTALGAALDATAAGKAIGGNATYNMPLVSAAAATVNLVAAVSGGNALVTANPVVRIKLLVCDMGD